MKISRLLKLAAIAVSILVLVWACQGNVSQQINSPKRAPTAECRLVKHSLGETCVPVDPKRVVVLDILDNVLTLGIKPVGAAAYDDGSFFTDLPEQAEGIPHVGLGGQPNLEKILSLEPDLILGIDWHSDIYDLLSKIAPTVLAKTTDGIDWKIWFNTYAEALGKNQEAQEILSDYNQRIAEFRQQMGDKRSQTQVSVVMFWDGVRIYMKRSFSGGILSDIGLPRPPEQDKDKVNEDISLELIPKMAGDTIFLMIGDRANELNRFAKNPLWSQLEAVKQGKVYKVKARTWLAGYGPVAANKVLDDLFKYLLKKSDTS
ncbi:MAG: iron-siderophore ABC transporter substrate-binding protein [Cyanosarcina radialis HA8281-LM2]|jgi:iron complex transport system substrate-binding protein|nr:iron-siderophore ABC transporter substrate-binding protein [Cyanosarcina radialis HA8281-LM2]